MPWLTRTVKTAETGCSRCLGAKTSVSLLVALPAASHTVRTPTAHMAALPVQRHHLHPQSPRYMLRATPLHQHSHSQADKLIQRTLLLQQLLLVLQLLLIRSCTAMISARILQLHPLQHLLLVLAICPAHRVCHPHTTLTRWASQGLRTLLGTTLKAKQPAVNCTAAGMVRMLAAVAVAKGQAAGAAKTVVVLRAVVALPSTVEVQEGLRPLVPAVVTREGAAAVRA